jgi:hypothetical protein
MQPALEEVRADFLSHPTSYCIFIRETVRLMHSKRRRISMNKRFILIGMTLLVLVLACGTIPSVTPPPIDDLATTVSMTLTAMAPGGVSPVPATDTPASPGTTPLPSGSLKVVYIKGGNAWLWTDGGTPAQLTTTSSVGDVKISDDAQVVAFIRNGELWAINADGSNLHTLAGTGYLAGFTPSDGGTVQVRAFDFAPGSHQVFFNTGIQTEAYFVPQYDLHSVDADNPSPTQLLSPGDGGNITFSPDGTWIALTTPETINAIRTNGSDYRSIFTFPMVLTYSEWFYVPDVVWISTGDGVYIVVPAHDPLANPSETTKFYYVPLSGSPAQLAEFPAAPAFFSRPLVAPNGSQVLYIKQVGTSPASYEIHLIDASTADTNYGSFASLGGLTNWSPDSSHFVFTKDDNRISWLGQVGSTETLLTDTTHSRFVTWVSGGRFLFVNDAELRIQLLGSPSILVDSGVDPGFPDFTQ